MGSPSFLLGSLSPHPSPSRKCGIVYLVQYSGLFVAVESLIGSINAYFKILPLHPKILTFWF